MQRSYLLAALMVLSCAIAAPASASSYSIISDPTLYDVTGTLSQDSLITFTYTSNGKSLGSFLAVAGDESLGGNSTSNNSFVSSGSPTASASSSTSLPSGLLTVLTTAVFKGVSTITIENFSDQTVNFDALFAATKLAVAGDFTTTGPSPVPLPASFVLFATALMGLFGFGMLRKARNKA